MLRILQSYNDHAINDGTSYQAVILNATSLPAAQPVFVTLPNADAADAGIYSVEPATVIVRVTIKNYANRIALTAQLQGWFKRGTLGDLVVTYTDDGLDYVKPCRVVNVVQEPEFPESFIITLNTGWTAWRAVDPDTYTWNLTGTGGDHTVTLLGDDETPLSVTFSLSAGPANGYLYQRLYELINAPQTVPALGYGPWCITIDTAALVADDTNKCQINQGAGIDASVTTIPYDTVTGAMPSAGSGYVDTEQIQWTGKTGTTSGNLTGVTRGIGGTTAAMHADNAEIKVSSILANCADLRIFLNGKETNRWIASPNNASTKVWINLTLDSGYNLTLRTALDSSSDYDYLYFALTTDTLNAITAMPSEGILVHGTEWIKYQKPTTPGHKLAVVARGVMGTTKQAHAVGDVLSYMQHVIAVCYGNTASTDPALTDATYDQTKPVFLLTSSTNASWVYDATTVFLDRYVTGRTGGFQPAILFRLGKDTTTYYVKRGSGTDPAMGMNMMSFYKSGNLTAEQASLAWLFYRACGIDTTTFTGEKYRGSTGFPATAALQSSVDGATYANVWNEATPGSAATWTALGSHSGVDMADVRWMRLLFDGSITAGASQQALFEIQTGTINFVSANLPTGTLGSQQLSEQIDLTLSNAANNDAFDASMPMLPGLTLALDGEAKTVLYNNVNAHEAITPDDESRDRWIRLVKGDNVLTISAVDVGTMAANLSWYRRRF